LKEKILKWRYFETGKKQGEIQNKELGNISGGKMASEEKYTFSFEMTNHVYFIMEMQRQT
jgi:hypothetical protein